ncbi:MAG: SPOR domain-containing protein [Flavobacteriales bacterium]|nr:SPOR domain-containing protein [Flavobacteriales bacterium]
MKLTPPYILLLILLLPTHLLLAQTSDSLEVEVEKSNEETFILKPTIGLGAGSLKFYGDVLDMKYGNPIIGRFAYELSIANDLTDFLKLKLYVLWGQTSANERNTDRNLNFKSRISTGGVILNYNFHHLLNKNRTLSPFIGLGIESLEFHSKTDLYDQYGNQYHYWSDGSIRNLPEDAPNASDAIRIQRDYFYETDLRESNYDGYGKYPERTWAVPIGTGFIMHLSKHLDFVLSSFLHLSFSDLIDNITKESEGDRMGLHLGNKGKDKLLFTSVSLHYNFQIEEAKRIEKLNQKNIDYLAIDGGDYDQDGVNDFIDECHVTPPNVKVNEKGCPLDSDKDGIPDYADVELNTSFGVPVLPDGSTFTDQLILKDYLDYMDSTGLSNAETIYRKMGNNNYKSKKYMVQVGSFKTGIDNEDINRFLSIADVKITTYGDTLTVITVGNYDNLPDALKRKIQLTEQGYATAEIVSQNDKGIIETVGDEDNNKPVNNKQPLANKDDETFYRVQLGAFNKKQPLSDFTGVSDLLEIKTDDGLFRYFSGSFKDKNNAEQHKNEMKQKGFQDSFVAEYKGGNRVAIYGSGNDINVTNPPGSKYKKENISYRVQLGIFRNQLPKEILGEYLKLGTVETIKEGELTRYVSGNFKSYTEAENLKNELIVKGFETAFVISFHNQEMISVKEAKALTE